MLTTIDGSQSYVFAQNSTSTLNNAPITPAQGASDSEDESSSSDDSDNNDESDSSIEEDSEQTNPLLDQIRNKVNGALSASGIPVP